MLPERNVSAASARLPGLGQGALGCLVLAGSALYLAECFYPAFGSAPPAFSRAAVGGWTLLFAAFYLLALRSFARKAPPAAWRAENGRWLVLLGVALFLLSGLTRAGMHGGGDARWYGTMLADAVAQVRAGVFPIWAGQSEYQFNGAIYPLRVAPAFHYLGVLLDVLTFRTLGLFALQNLLLVGLGVLAIFSAYFSLAALLPGRRNLAAGLAVLYLACPGVLGLAYNTDLYMSWTTLPWIPLVWFATVQSFRGGKTGTLLLLGGSLGLLWWCHSPIALWTTLCAALAQLARLIVQRPPQRDWRQAGAGALAFALIAAYPLSSVLFFPPEPGLSGRSFQPPVSPRTIAGLLREVFPASWLPLSARGQALSDFQVGYALAALGLFALWHWRRIRQPEGRVLLVLSAGLLLLLLPIPTVDALLWSGVPAFVREITARWVMNRLYLVLAGIAIFALAAAAGDLATEVRRARLLHGLLVVGCVWSVVEARKFAYGSQVTAGNVLASPRALPTENVMLTRYAYFIFPRLPAYFTHGVTAAELENRLWRASDGTMLASNLRAARAAGTVLGQTAFSPKPGTSEETLPEAFSLQPGKRYLLDFEFSDRAPKGVLQFSGTTFFREYALPDYGEKRSFGAGGEHETALPVWTSQPEGEQVSLRFIRTDASVGALAAPNLGRITWRAYDPASLPVRVISWIPYRAEVAASEAAWLETPRMFQQAYAATVNGATAEIRKSDAGLVMVRVPPGPARVELVYRAPAGLALAFWTSLLTLAAGAIGLLVRIGRLGFLSGIQEIKNEPLPSGSS